MLVEMTNEKALFAQRLIAAMQAQGYKPEPPFWKGDLT
jgi:hypothetical protein